MKYPRPPFLAPGIPVVKSKIMFSTTEVDVPKPDFPVTPLENFKLAAAHKTPYWVPNSLTDFQTLFTKDLYIDKNAAPSEAPDLTKNYSYKDWFGVDWTWVAEAGGPMLTPNTQFLEDITNWEKEVIFPDLSSFDWDTPADDFMKNKYDPNKVLHVNIGQSCTERLVAILGGYTEGMTSLLIEPEAVSDFLNRFADFTIEIVDLICDRYPVNFMTFHDDWGTERDTFFSERVMEELVYGPTKRIIDHIKSKGCIFELHSCGNIARFIPYMIDLGVDFMQIQRRAVDIPMVKEKYGDKIGINTHLEGHIYGIPLPPIEKYLDMIHKTVDLYAKGGGFYTSTQGTDAEFIWNAVFELFGFSREFYEKERGI